MKFKKNLIDTENYKIVKQILSQILLIRKNWLQID